jgi:hypothetical protein
MNNINKKIRTFSFVMALASMILAGIFMQSCSSEGEEIFFDYSKLEITDFKNWLKSQEITNEFIGDQELNWDNVKMKPMPDGGSTQVSFEIYNGENSLGNDSIRELQIAYVKNSFVGGVKIFSFYDKENAHVKCYSLSGQILEEGIYYAPKQLYMLLKRYTDGRGIVRLKAGNESNNPCDGTQMYTNSATPLIINGAPNPAAYNCHAYVWGTLSSNDPCYNPNYPQWNNCPNISGSGYSQVSMPQVGDRWVSYGSVSGWGYVPVHSAIVVEVTNGQVTKVRAKCGEQEIYIYNPNCDAPLFTSYKTNDIKYYRK